MAPGTDSDVSGRRGAGADAVADEVTQAESTPGRRKKIVRVRKDRDGAAGGAPADAARILTSYRPTARAAGVVYVALLLLRLALVFAPGVVEHAESTDGADAMAAALLPGLHVRAGDVPLPAGMAVPGVLGDSPAARAASKNYTRSVVGAFVTSGIPYMAVNVACRKIPAVDRALCAPSRVGYVAVYAPRLWMYALSLIGDVLLVNVFAVYNSEHAVSALLTYASSWMTLLVMARNNNFALEALCLLGLLAACFGWTYRTPRPVFWLSATALALGIFLRPVFAVFVCTPLIYLVSLWGKNGVDPLHYARAALEGLAIFGFWVSIWVSVDSAFLGTFKFRFGTTVMNSFDMFVDHALLALTGSSDSPGKFNYKGYLVSVPLNACKGLFSKAFWSQLLRNTSPGQMFIQLPVVLGPLMIILLRESVDGMRAAIKELMGEIKSATNDKKGKKKRTRKTGMSKEREEEMLVYFDTIQTTLLLGLLLEVMQNHERIGLMSMLALNAPAVICVAPYVFGETGMPTVRRAHYAYSLAMVVFYGIMHQSGIGRMLLAAGAGGVASIQPKTDVVVYRGQMHHPSSALGANVKGIRVHDGGQSRSDLMTKLRTIKSGKDFDESRLLICAAGTIDMREEFVLVDKVGFGHMSVDDMPDNLDAALGSANLHLYKFVGDEDEALMRDKEEAAEREEQENEQKKSRRDR